MVRTNEVLEQLDLSEDALGVHQVAEGVAHLLDSHLAPRHLSPRAFANQISQSISRLLPWAVMMAWLTSWVSL